LVVLNFPSILFAADFISVSALGLNISRDAGKDERKSNKVAKETPIKSKDSARSSISKKAGRVDSSSVKQSKKSERATKKNRISKRQQSQKKRGGGALGFSALKRKKQASPKDANSQKAKRAVAKKQAPKAAPVPPHAPEQRVASKKAGNADSAASQLDKNRSINESVGKPQQPAIASSSPSPSAGGSAMTLAAVPPVVSKSSGSGFSVKSIFTINRRTEPQFISKTLAFSSESENPLTKFAYSWYWGHAFAAISYRSNEVVDDIYVSGLSEQLMQSKILKSQEHVRVYPFNWLTRYSRLQISYGLFYSRRDYSQIEQSDDSVTFNNESSIIADQYGLQSSFLYRGRSWRFRGFLHIPATIVSVTENYEYNDQGLPSTFDSSVTGAAQLAYEVSLDVLMKTNWGFSMQFSGAYEALPLEYSRVSVTRNIDDQIEFDHVPYQAENRSIDLSASLLFDALSIGNISPFVAINLNRDVRHDEIRSTSLTTNHFDMQMGFSGQF